MSFKIGDKVCLKPIILQNFIENSSNDWMIGKPYAFISKVNCTHPFGEIEIDRCLIMLTPYETGHTQHWFVNQLDLYDKYDTPLGRILYK